MKVIYTVNGRELDSYSLEEQGKMLTQMLVNATHAIGYEFNQKIDMEKLVAIYVRKEIKEHEQDMNNNQCPSR